MPRPGLGHHHDALEGTPLALTTVTESPDGARMPRGAAKTVQAITQASNGRFYHAYPMD